MDITAQATSVKEHTLQVFSDNTPTVSWATKGSITTTKPPATFLYMLAMHQRQHQYLLNMSCIPGDTNEMANNTSHLTHLSDTTFVANFNLTYPQTTPLQQMAVYADYLPVQVHICVGVGSLQQQSADSSWQRWLQFCKDLELPPTLHNITNRIIYLQLFALGIRDGRYSKSRTSVCANTVDDTVCQVGQMLQAIGLSIQKKN